MILPFFGVQLDDVAGDQVDDVEAVFVVGRRGGVEAADPPFPESCAGLRVEGEGEAGVVDRVEDAADVDRRELEQRALGVAPEFAEGRLDPARGQVAGALRVQPVHRPVDRRLRLTVARLRFGRFLRLFRLEVSDRGLVVDVGGALQLLLGDDHRGDRDDHQADQREGDAPMLAPQLARVDEEGEGRAEALKHASAAGRSRGPVGPRRAPPGGRGRRGRSGA